MDTDKQAEGFERVVDRHPPLDSIAQGLSFGEGPVWDKRHKVLYWVDIIGSTIWKWTPGVGREVVLQPSRHANGMTFDLQGRLVVAGWCSRSIWRFEPDGVITTIAAGFEGRKFNSPNDIIVHSDGSIWWTDSAGGLVIPGMVAEDVQRYIDESGIYRLSPDGKTVTMAISDCAYPNGLAFSPDEKLIYANDTMQGLIRVFDVHEDGSTGPGRLFHTLTGTEDGVADGLKVDVEGNVYCTGPGGMHIIDPQGKLLCRLRVPEHCTNMAFGDDDMKSLYITTFNSVLRTRVNIPGIAPW
jgi:gluconolactonase